MTTPILPHSASDPWGRFTAALLEGSAGTERDVQETCLDQALRAVCPPGAIHCVLQDNADPSSVSQAQVAIPVADSHGVKAWLGWSGEAALHEPAAEALTLAAERLSPVLASWSTLRQVVRTDPLTGAGSRHALHESLRAQLGMAARHHAPLSAIMLDADRFKTINDTRGHAAGDRALTTLTEWLRGALRGHDQLFRYGGDEFVVLLPHTDEAGARRLAGRLCEGSPVAISAGTATAADRDTPESLLERADQSLLKAKKVS